MTLWKQIEAKPVITYLFKIIQDCIFSKIYKEIAAREIMSFIIIIIIIMGEIPTRKTKGIVRGKYSVFLKNINNFSIYDEQKKQYF